ncbi:MAG: TonB family protein [Flavobacteriales bacterium]|nr:TonB family protein [Flavobacteriales bacterium]
MIYAIAFVVLLVLSLLLTMDNSWMNVLQQVRNNVVFANHNRAYGAFMLRKDYNKRLGLAMLLGIGVFLAAMGAPMVISKMGSGDDEMEVKKKIVDVNLELFEEQPEEPPPPPEVIPPPQPQIETVQFVAVEAADEPVDEPPPTQADLTETTAGQTNQEGQNIDAPPPPPPVEEETFDLAAVQEQPEFPGGMEKMYEFLGKLQKYPDMEADAGIQGKVYVEFVVEKDGKISDVKLKKGVSAGLDKEAQRLVKAMPNWNPGKMNGKAVKCRFVLPVKFTLR